MGQRRFARTFALAAVATVAASAQAVNMAEAKTAAPPPPASGAWKLVPIGASGLVSARFTVSHRTVSGLHGTFTKRPGCASGTFTVGGRSTIRDVALAGGVHDWAVASGRNRPGGLAATPIDLTIGGHTEVDANITLGFPERNLKGAGEINWGPVSGGIQPCTILYYAVPA